MQAAVRIYENGVDELWLHDMNRDQIIRAVPRDSIEWRRLVAKVRKGGLPVSPFVALVSIAASPQPGAEWAKPGELLSNQPSPQRGGTPGSRFILPDGRRFVVGDDGIPRAFVDE